MKANQISITQQLTFETAAYFQLSLEDNDLRYPVLDEDGLPTERGRVKHLSPKKGQGKYTWTGSGNTPRYYHPAGFKHAAETGTLIIASGEPDLWVLFQAGIKNVVCWFGENQVPPDLINRLKAHDITSVITYTDRDKAGDAMAHKLNSLLSDSGIAYRPKKVPGEYRDNGGPDLRDYWVQCLDKGLKPTDFRQHLEALDQLEPVTPEAKTQERSATVQQKQRTLNAPSSTDLDFDNLYKQWSAQVEAEAVTTWRIPKPDSKGFAKFSSPIRPDRNPSASWNYNKHGFKDFGSDVEFSNTHEVARLLGLTSWEDFKEQAIKQHWAARKQDFKNNIQAFERVNCTDHQIATRYIDQVEIDRGKVTVIRSPMGTGKTTWLNSILHHKRVLVILHRNRLNQSLTTKLRGFRSHTSVEPDERHRLRTFDRLVITINSLHYLQDSEGRVPRYDYIVIEESEQTFKHLAGKTFKHLEGVNTIGILEALFHKSRHIIALDANAGRITVETLANLLPNANIIRYTNTYQMSRPDVVIHSNRETLLAKLDEALRAGERCYFVSDSKREIKAIAEKYKEYRVLAIHQDNDNVAKVNKLLPNLDQEFLQLDLIAASPSIDSGVDLQTPAKVFALFTGQSNSPDDWTQQIGRVRNPEGEIQVYCGKYRATKPSCDPDELLQKFTTNWAKGQKILWNRVGDRRMIHPDTNMYLLLTSRVAAHKNLLSRNKRLTFQILMEMQGYNVIVSKETIAEEVREKIRKDMKEAASSVKAAERELLLSADPVDYAEFEHLKNNSKITPQIAAGHQRWKLEELFGCTLNNELADEAEKFNYPGSVENFLLLRRKPQALRDSDQNDQTMTTIRGATGAIDRLPERYAKRDALDKFVTALLDGPLLTVAYDATWTECSFVEKQFVEYLEENSSYIEHHWWLRSRQMKNPRNTLNALLRKVGLATSKRQVKLPENIRAAHPDLFAENQKRYGIYAVDLNRLVRMIELSDRLAAKRGYELEKLPASLRQLIEPTRGNQTDTHSPEAPVSILAVSSLESNAKFETLEERDAVTPAQSPESSSVPNSTQLDLDGFEDTAQQSMRHWDA